LFNQKILNAGNSALTLLIQTFPRDSWRLLWSFHHIILDGYSQLIFIKALISKDEVEPYSTTDPYEDFLTWQDNHVTVNKDAHKNFWIKLLGEAQRLSKVASLSQSFPITRQVHRKTRPT
jgi:hypothetical protein